MFEKPTTIFMVRESVNFENQSFKLHSIEYFVSCPDFSTFLSELGRQKVVIVQKRTLLNSCRYRGCVVVGELSIRSSGNTGRVGKEWH